MNRTVWVCLFLAFSAASSYAADDIIIADFEGDTYGSWKTTGTAFGKGPAKGTLPNQMHVDGFKGKGLVNSYHGGDTAVGTLTSPAFKIDRKYIGFLIGGGKDKEKLSINLLIDNKVKRTATGPNDQSGGSEALAPDSWDVSEFVGQMAVIQIVDNATGGWGHINVDHIVQTDKKPPGNITDAKRDFAVEKNYMNIPIKNGAKKRKVMLLVDGRVIVRNDIELADDKPDWWAPMDVSAYKGKTVRLQVDQLSEDSKALANIEQTDTYADAKSLYREPLRGQIHFSPRRGWNNDPNGMVYYNGEYHLFFQHNPYGWDWGNMHWGHAVSKEMVHWEELDDVLAPDELGAMFSGSAVVDWNNSSGFGKDGKPPLVLIYTAAGNPTTQCLAYSNDGRKFVKYSGNPIVKQITDGNRDPKVFWYEPTKRWVMTLYVEVNKVHTIQFFTSTNLKDWTFESKVDGFFECPDFFELPVDGDASKKKWVLTAASSEYMIGRFDGKTFTPETTKQLGHRGKGFYAAQTFSDIPATDGRRIQIGWFQTPTRGMPFNQSMTIPLELKLISTKDGPRLTMQPVKELEQLRTKTHNIAPANLSQNGANPLANIKGELLELRAEIDPGTATEIELLVRGEKVFYEVKKQDFLVNGYRTFAPLRDSKLKFTLYLDRMGMELFASDGLTYVPMPMTPKANNVGMSLHAKSGTAKLLSMQVYELGSAWKATK